MFSSDIWWQQWKNTYMVSTNFLTQKTIGKKKYFHNFLASRNVLKREIFVNSSPQKFLKKYRIVSAYSVTFVFQKTLTCLQWMCLWLSYSRFFAPTTFRTNSNSAISIWDCCNVCEILIFSQACHGHGKIRMAEGGLKYDPSETFIPTIRDKMPFQCTCPFWSRIP